MLNLKPPAYNSQDSIDNPYHPFHQEHREPPYNPQFVSENEMTPLPPPPYNPSPYMTQDQLGREMREAVVFSETQWVESASLPTDNLANRILKYIGSFIQVNQSLDNIDHKMRAKLWREAGELGLARMQNDLEAIALAEKKTDVLFQQFLKGLEHDEKNPEHCFKSSLEYFVSPEAFFSFAKYQFSIHDYSASIELFKEAFLHAKNLESSSSYRIKSFQALTKACGAAAQERLNMHEKALLNYMDAANLDPKGPKSYEKALSRNFQILKFKPNKTDEELHACMEYDPKEADFVIELAHHKLDQGYYENALQLLNKANELSFHNRPSAFYKCAELAQRMAFAINNVHPRFR